LSFVTTCQGRTEGMTRKEISTPRSLIMKIMNSLCKETSGRGLPAVGDAWSKFRKIYIGEDSDKLVETENE
jgi:hypothetical protein